MSNESKSKYKLHCPDCGTLFTQSLVEDYIAGKAIICEICGYELSKRIGNLVLDTDINSSTDASQTDLEFGGSQQKNSSKTNTIFVSQDRNFKVESSNILVREIQDAVDQSIEGSIIQISPGIYHKELIIHDKNLTIMGIGLHVKLDVNKPFAIKITESRIKFDNLSITRTGDSFDQQKNGLGNNEICGIWASGLTTELEFRNIKVTSYNSDAYLIDNIKKVIMEDCVASNSNIGFNIRNRIMDSSSFLRNCTAENNKQFGFKISNGCTLNFKNCVSNTNGDSGFSISDSGTKINCENCRTEKNKRNGFLIYLRSVVKCEECQSRNNGNSGYYVSDYETNANFIRCGATNNKEYGFISANRASAVCDKCDAYGNKHDFYLVDKK
jgi:hypothetical protein